MAFLFVAASALNIWGVCFSPELTTQVSDGPDSKTVDTRLQNGANLGVYVGWNPQLSDIDQKKVDEFRRDAKEPKMLNTESGLLGVPLDEKTPFFHVVGKGLPAEEIAMRISFCGKP